MKRIPVAVFCTIGRVFCDLEGESFEEAAAAWWGQDGPGAGDDELVLCGDTYLRRSTIVGLSMAQGANGGRGAPTAILVPQPGVPPLG